MSSLSEFKWLHISDIHLNCDDSGYDRAARTIVAQKLADDAADLARSIGGIDVVILTGDVAWSARTVEYEEAHKWLADLLRKLNIGPDRLFVVPGNHDLDRDYIKNEVLAVHQQIRRDPKKLDDYDYIGIRKNIFGKFAEFYNHIGLRGLKGPDPEQVLWKTNFLSADTNIDLIGLNTCLAAYNEEDSEKNIVLGNNQLS
jgi:predicted MPP superfamily phosphohydrolase